MWLTSEAIRRGKMFYRKVFPVVTGTRRSYESDFSAAIPFAYDLTSSTPPGRIAAVCHIFHADLAGRMRDALENVPYAMDVFISTDTDVKRAVIAAAFTGWAKGDHEIRLCPNKGRDIAPKLVTFRDVYDRYDFVLFLHSKKSAQNSYGDAWRQTLTDGNAGSPDVVRSIMEIFAVNPKIGVVMPQHFEPIRPFLDWNRNYRFARRLGRRMGIAITPSLMVDMPSGSMFWARTKALRPLLDLQLGYKDFPPEQGQVLETVMHAIERMVLYACEHAGYDWMKVADPRHYETTSTVVPIASRDDLRHFMAANCIRLLPERRA